jgi:hypothetical protein
MHYTEAIRQSTVGAATLTRRDGAVLMISYNGYCTIRRPHMPIREAMPEDYQGYDTWEPVVDTDTLIKQARSNLADTGRLAECINRLFPEKCVAGELVVDVAIRLIEEYKRKVDAQCQSTVDTKVKEQ